MYQQDKSLVIKTDVQQTLTQNICPSHLYILAYLYNKSTFLSSTVELKLLLLPTVVPLIAKIERSLQGGSSSTLYYVYGNRIIRSCLHELDENNLLTSNYGLHPYLRL
jgi:hypothetical protein